MAHVVSLILNFMSVGSLLHVALKKPAMSPCRFYGSRAISMGKCRLPASGVAGRPECFIGTGKPEVNTEYGFIGAIRPQRVLSVGCDVTVTSLLRHQSHAMLIADDIPS